MMARQMLERAWSSAAVALALGALLIGITLLSLYNLNQVETAAEWVAHTHAVSSDLNACLATLDDAETGQRGFLITGDDSYLAPYRTSVSVLDSRFRHLADLTRDNPAQQADAGELRRLANEKLTELARTIAVRRSDGFAAAQAIVATHQGKETMDAIRAVEDRMLARETMLLTAREAAAHRSSRAARWSGLLSALIALSAVFVAWRGHRRQIATREQAAEAIAGEREQLRVTLLGIGDGVVTVDATGRVTMVNPVAEQLTGWSNAAAAGRQLTEIFRIVNEDTRSEVVNPVTLVFSTGRIQALANHTVLIAADGTERPIDDSAAPIRNARGDMIGAVLVFRDVSARRAAERRLNLALEDARESATMKDQFVAAVSHELRTPLNAILGWTSMIERGVVAPEKLDSSLASISRNAKALAQLIEDLLESSRLLTGKIRLVTDRVDLAGVVADAVDAVGLAAANKGITLDVATSPVAPIRGDADRLKQVLWNLLGNAIKFSPPGGTVTLRIEPHQGAVRVLVADQGAGISEALLPFVFERFSQGDERTGLGLGLAIAKHLVELHGGTIEAHSDGAGRGAAFTILLPVAGERSEMVEDAAASG
jgi:PAS domain S-box-containing protein